MKFEVIKIERGEIISEPGVYDIPMDWYHDDCCIGPSVSSSGLRDIELDCPAAYWATSKLNRDRIVDPEEDEKAEAVYFRIGRAAHTMLLEPALFDQMIARPPVFRTKDGSPSTSFATKEAKEWVAKVQRDGKTVLTDKEYRQVAAICESLRAHPLHQDGIFQGQIERAIIWKDRKTGIWLKSRPDNIPAGGAMLTDLKVLAGSHPDAVRNAIRAQGYDMQLALGGIGLAEVCDLTIEDYAVVAVASKAPHLVHVATIGDVAIHYARCRLRSALDTFAKCWKDQYWPAYDDRLAEAYQPSDWDLKSYGDRQKAGRLAEGW